MNRHDDHYRRPNFSSQSDNSYGRDGRSSSGISSSTRNQDLAIGLMNQILADASSVSRLEDDDLWQDRGQYSSRGPPRQYQDERSHQSAYHSGNSSNQKQSSHYEDQSYHQGNSRDLYNGVNNNNNNNNNSGMSKSHSSYNDMNNDPSRDHYSDSTYNRSLNDASNSDWSRLNSSGSARNNQRSWDSDWNNSRSSMLENSRQQYSNSMFDESRASQSQPMFHEKSTQPRNSMYGERTRVRSRNNRSRSPASTFNERGRSRGSTLYNRGQHGESSSNKRARSDASMFNERSSGSHAYNDRGGHYESMANDRDQAYVPNFNEGIQPLLSALTEEIAPLLSTLGERSRPRMSMANERTRPREFRSSDPTTTLRSIYDEITKQQLPYGERPRLKKQAKRTQRLMPGDLRLNIMRGGKPRHSIRDSGRVGLPLNKTSQRGFSSASNVKSRLQMPRKSNSFNDSRPSIEDNKSFEMPEIQITSFKKYLKFSGVLKKIVVFEGTDFASVLKKAWPNEIPVEALKCTPCQVDSFETHEEFMAHILDSTHKEYSQLVGEIREAKLKIMRETCMINKHNTPRTYIKDNMLQKCAVCFTYTKDAECDEHTSGLWHQSVMEKLYCCDNTTKYNSFHPLSLEEHQLLIPHLLNVQNNSKAEATAQTEIVNSTFDLQAEYDPTNCYAKNFIKQRVNFHCKVCDTNIDRKMVKEHCCTVTHFKQMKHEIKFGSLKSKGKRSIQTKKNEEDMEMETETLLEVDADLKELENEEEQEEEQEQQSKDEDNNEEEEENDEVGHANEDEEDYELDDETAINEIIEHELPTEEVDNENDEEEKMEEDDEEEEEEEIKKATPPPVVKRTLRNQRTTATPSSTKKTTVTKTTKKTKPKIDANIIFEEIGESID